jgi:putative DNA primase/helicase
MTATEVLIRLEYKHPTNAQSKEAAAALRDLLGVPKRIRGQNRWPIPLDETRQFGAGSVHSDYF